jgi:hypothetical protein
MTPRDDDRDSPIGAPGPGAGAAVVVSHQFRRQLASGLLLQARRRVAPFCLFVSP